MMELKMLQDIRYAFRSLCKTPAFTIAALAALTIGIGANTAIFSVLEQVLLKPLPYPDPGRIVLLFVDGPNGAQYGASAAKYNLWRQQDASFAEVAAYEYRGSNLTFTGETIPEDVHSIRVSSGYFHLFAASLVKGRSFTTEEDQPNGPHVALLSYGLWQRRFGGKQSIVGQTLVLSGVPYMVVGVVGSNFNTELDSPPDVFLPFQIDPASADHAQFFNVVGRLRPGMTASKAKAQLQTAANAFRRKFPNIMGTNDRFNIEPLQEALVTDTKPALLLFTGAVVLVLLIACANVANLLLVRGTSRKREMTLRLALGASRVRIVRQLLTESVALSMMGGLLGLIAGCLTARTLSGFNPLNISRFGMHGSLDVLDWRVVLFTALLSPATAILFGLFPALGISREQFGSGLKEGGPRSGTSKRQSKARSLLVAGESALALTLLIGSGLLLRSFLELRTTNRGIATHQVLALQTSLPGGKAFKSSEVAQLVRETKRRLEGLTGVQVASASYSLPLDGAFGIPFKILGATDTSNRYDGRGWMAISAGYFSTFKIPVLRGRVFSERDDSAAPMVAIINQVLARRYWPTGNPIGGRLLLGQNYGPEFKEPAREVIGVVGDVLNFGSKVPQPVVYVPLGQVTDGVTSLLTQVASLEWSIRSPLEPHSLEVAARSTLREVSAGIGITSVRTLDDIVGTSTAMESFQTVLLTIFASAALLLAAFGMYGIIAYSTQQRTHEIGIRLALGASPANVRNMFMAQGVRPALTGSAAGITASLALSRLLSQFLFGVKPWDALTFCSVPLFVFGVLLVAVWYPSRRATRVDPVVAFRYE